MSVEGIVRLRPLVVGFVLLIAGPAGSASLGPDDPVRVSLEPPPAAIATSPARFEPEKSQPVAAQPAAPSLDRLVAEGLARSPSIAALAARVAAAEAMIRPAGALPDPMIEGMLRDAGFPRYTVGTAEMSMVGIEVRQGLSFPGKRTARRAAARADATTRARELEQLERALVTQIRRTYARLYALDREAAALTSIHVLLELLSTTTVSRYSVGQTELRAVAQAQLGLSRLDERRDDLAAERQVAVAALYRLLDRPGVEPFGEVTELPDSVLPPEPWEELAVANAAEVAVARAAVDAAERRLQVARLDLWPNLSAASGIASRGRLEPVVTLGLGIELPFWRGEKQQPLIQAAAFEVTMAEEELRDAEATARFEAIRLRAEWQRAARQVQRYRQAIVPQTDLVLDAGRASYESGRGELSTVIEDFNLWLSARVELARREADQLETWSEIDALVAPQLRPARQGEAQ